MAAAQQINGLSVDQLSPQVRAVRAEEEEATRGNRDHRDCQCAVSPGPCPCPQWLYFCSGINPTITCASGMNLVNTASVSAWTHLLAFLLAALLHWLCI